MIRTIRRVVVDYRMRLVEYWYPSVPFVVMYRGLLLNKLDDILCLAVGMGMTLRYVGGERLVLEWNT